MPNIHLIPNDYILRKHPDVSWPKWLQMVWNDIEWPVVILLSFTSLTLGTMGFMQYQIPDGIQNSLWDSLYESLQLFSLQGNFYPSVSIPVFLQIARFLSPALAA